MSWTNIAKPSSSNYTNVAKPAGVATIRAGAYLGPLGLTYFKPTTITNWLNIAKPGSNSWTNIAKPT